MDNWKNCVLDEKSTVRDAIQNLNDTSARVVLIVDQQFKLLGLVVDGDIRRGMLKGVQITDRLAEVINQKPVTVAPQVNRIDVLSLMTTLQVSHIPIVDDDNRLVGLHSINAIPVVGTRENLFIIMAGGFGRRMGSLTEKTPKPMLEIAGKPILEHLIVRAKSNGFKNFAISIYYLGHVIEEYFGDGSTLGVNIEYLHEDEPLGTAGALQLLNPIPNEPFLVSNADLVSDVDFAALLEFHNSQKCDATMAVREHQWQNPFGVVEIVGGHIVKIIEKPITSSTVSAGIFAFNPTVTQLVNDSEFCDMPTLFQRLIAGNGKACAFPLHENWTDIGRKAELETARGVFWERSVDKKLQI
jgi:dTDP-glucose pyrophosphorylase